ncbi:MAG: bis-aminopropyl spermidine synthase family protein, partial [Microthrixaceae bacterium]|nr:bis-aminopropyl spermidine synthase family protein [Microthrixaceae bacterium]
MSTEADGEHRINTNVETDTAPAGLATTALRPAVRLLVQRPASLGELVTASGVSRRGVEALLASWQEDEPAEGGLKVDHEDRYRLTEPLRSRVAAEWGIDQPADDRRLCDPAMIERLTAWATDLPRPRRDLDHRPATPEGVANRLDLLATHLDLRGASILVLGARDLDAAALATDGRARRVATLDVDDAVLAAVGAADLPPKALTLRWCDVRVGLPASLTGWADLVISDPPYTPAGMEAFLAAATGALSGPEARVAISYGFGETRATLGWQVQREMLRANLALCAMWPDVVTYEGAEAIGGRADLYLLAPTG